MCLVVASLPPCISLLGPVPPGATGIAFTEPQTPLVPSPGIYIKKNIYIVYNYLYTVYIDSYIYSIYYRYINIDTIQIYIVYRLLLCTVSIYIGLYISVYYIL